ncbi:MAG: hypothetical protein MAG451_01415 [Anaerolineales bacterium]|nr:hypothetical protein [Anaerolineales bacterium]
MDTQTLLLAVVMFALLMAPLLYFFRAVLRFSRSLELVEDDEGAESPERLLRAPAVDYALSTVLAMPFEDALTQTELALREEGFGVVSEIDVAEMLGGSGIRSRPYTILAAWDADTMTQVLKVERTAGLLMPARVVVVEVDGGTVVSAVDVRRLLEVAHNPALLPLAVEARAQLQRAIDRLDVGTVTLNVKRKA